MDGRARRGLGVIVAAGLAFAASASAATFSVNSTADAVDATPGNGTCATAQGVCTLRAAVQEANALAGPDAITLPAGTFLLTVAGAAEDAAATGDLDVTQPLEITGAGSDATIVDGLAADRVFHVPAAGPSLTLRALAVRNGDDAPNPGGGLFHAGGGPLTLDDVRFRNNRAGIGGGIAMGPNGTFTIVGSRFEDNLAVGAGAIAHQAGAATLDVRDSTFERNHAGTGGTGGGIGSTGTGIISITGTTFRGNTSDEGGGFAASGASQVTLDGCTFEDNRASGTTSNGGGVMLEMVGAFTARNTVVRGNVAYANVGGMMAQAESATVTGSTFEDNGAGVSVGGLYVVSGVATLVSIEDTVFRRNVAETGLAGALYAIPGGSLTLTRVLVEDNFALGAAGGAQITAAAGDVTVGASRFSRNTTLLGTGGGFAVASSGTVAVTDTLLEDNVSLVGGGAQVLSATLRVATSTFARNLAAGAGAAGGGLVVSGTTASIENATFSDNVTSGSGGAIYHAATAMTISSSTFVGNQADTGSAVYDPGSTATIRGSVIAGGIGTGACAPAASPSAGDNVDQDGGCGFAGPRDRSGLDPLLGPLQDNGGPTPTHEPLPGSPLIDGDGGVCPATDQRGVARPTDGNGDGTPTCDVGAVEFVDECPQDPDKRLPGVCGCGVADVDANANGAIDCLVNAELKARIATEKTSMQAITGVKSDEQTALKSAVKAGADDLLAYVDANGATIVKADPAADLAKLAKKARKLVRKTLKGKGKALQKKQARAGAALDGLDAAVAVQP